MTPEIVAEVRVHGNHTTPDDEILKLAGISLGQPLEANALDAIAQRLEKTGRFEGVEVRKRYRSLTDTSSVVLVLIIDERPNPGELPVPAVLRPMQALRDRLMFLPIITYADGYGFTYGGRATFANALGGRSRVSVPLTWGANRRAAVEGERLFKHGPVSRVEGALSFGQRENPYYDVDDRRAEAWVRAERRLPGNLRVGGRFGWTDVTFGESVPPDVLAIGLDPYDRFTSYGADLTFDTRTDPTFPRNAIVARASWEALRFEKATDVNRYTLEGRGYVGLVKSAVFSVRVPARRRDRTPARVRAMAARRELDAAWFSHGQLRRRSTLHVDRGDTPAAHLADERRQDRVHGVCRRREGLAVRRPLCRRAVSSRLRRGPLLLGDAVAAQRGCGARVGR